MMRWDIINHLIEKNNYKSYLEIGYYKGWSFDNVNCDFKIAVDPNPCKIQNQQSWEKGYHNLEYGDSYSYGIYKMTSDEFFEQREEKVLDDIVRQKGIPFDIIFIDGLHEAEQVSKDIVNSLKHLSVGGTIVLHDCNPPKYEHTTIGLEGCWTGDVYKAAIKFQDDHADWYNFYCVDTDWGVGIIQKRKFGVDYFLPHSVGILFGKDYDNSWTAFDQNREGLLNLISVEKFLKKEQYETVS